MSLDILAPAPIELETRDFVTRVYAWTFVALLITAGVAAIIAGTPAVASVPLSNQILIFGLLIGELILVVALAGQGLPSITRPDCSRLVDFVKRRALRFSGDDLVHGGGSRPWLHHLHQTQSPICPLRITFTNSRIRGGSIDGFILCRTSS